MLNLRLISCIYMCTECCIYAAFRNNGENMMGHLLQYCSTGIKVWTRATAHIHSKSHKNLFSSTVLPQCSVNNNLTETLVRTLLYHRHKSGLWTQKKNCLKSRKGNHRAVSHMHLRVWDKNMWFVHFQDNLRLLEWR